MIKVVYSPTYLGYLVYKFDRKDNGTTDFWTNEGTVKNLRLNGGEEAPYWIQIDDKDADDILKGLVKQGYEPNLPNDDSYMAGKLEAQTQHLEDMRRLVMDGMPGEKS